MLLNETIFHDEKGTYRARAGGAFNFPMGDGSLRRGDGGVGSGQTFPVAGTIPIARQVSGTLSTSGTEVRGSTDFSTTIKQGDWLYNGGAGGVHQVREIAMVDGKIMKLKQAFSTDIVSSIILVCARQDLKKIVVENVHASTNAILQEALFGFGKRFENGGAPITYDQTGGGTLEFTVHK